MRDKTILAGGAALVALSLAVPTVASADIGDAAAADLVAWANPLSDDEMADLRGTGGGFDLSATFIVSDQSSASFDVSGRVLPTSVAGAPSVSPLGSGQVQISAQLSGLAGFNGIGTFVSVNGNHNVTTTTTTVNILYAPNMAAQTAMTAFRALPLGS